MRFAEGGPNRKHCGEVLACTRLVANRNAKCGSGISDVDVARMFSEMLVGILKCNRVPAVCDAHGDQSTYEACRLASGS